MRAQSLERALAAASLALVLVVIAASAAIRLSGQDLGAWLPAVRLTHRLSASLATLLIVVSAVLAWRGGRRSLAVALVLVTAFLSVLGAATGVSPPAWAQAGNLLGGLLLAALLSALLAPKAPPRKTVWLAFAAQACLGAWIAIYAEELWTPVFLTHVVLGLAIAGLVAWLSIRNGLPAAVLLALAVPASGAAAALFDLPLGAMLAHSASVALLVCTFAYLRARLA
jgi:hypothetical protein